ncbi:hypothetical protein LJR219_004237 [Phenylobacterium sp. LjRoot219]|uniref:methyltransferase domain-containing protein n=1 Tax=Phenylobacterium sp. LjRoot219 TaxID=3342283 RepID=UPI003ECD5F51
MGLKTNSAETTNGEALYGEAFFAGIDAGAQRSAEIVVPLLLEVFSPRSVVDFGGGAGHWAAACLARGVRDVLTIDGPWVPPSARVMPAERFLEHDLGAPLVLDRRFDLALCLEAAEHLPASAAEALVRALTAAAPVVAFSAALPGQGGDGHINEQPASYWARLFAARGYACFTDFRRRIWNDAAVEVWYRQNLLCFVRRSEIGRWGAGLDRPVEEPDLDVAHPDLLLRHKARGDQLEVYADRLEREGEAMGEKLEQTRAALERREAELLQCQAELKVFTASPLWRGWRLAVRVGRGVRRSAARRVRPR